ncbi:carbamoyltransferase [Calothrix sp. CCY 0018]|uniref:carbamoyltransferase family protein n=1 Tax=Calothrix sp. CCY 0018 TaxID=3103864 RepID=UPI0039C64507
MNILGINAFHGDASACLVQNGQLIAAVEEERFTRVKHWAGFPSQSIRYCLEAGGITAPQIDRVAVSFNPKANLKHKLLFTLQKRPSLSSLFDRFRKQRKSASIQQELAEACGCDVDAIKATIHNLEHHSTHAAHSFFVSPFPEAAILCVDGMGDFTSTLLAAGRNNQLEYFSRTIFPHSLGYLYNAITLYLGFPNYGDEYKVMGLAAYGEPEYLEAFRKLVYPSSDGLELNLDYFTHHKQGISMKWDKGAPIVEPFHSQELEKFLGEMRKPGTEITSKHKNIAASLQAVTEEIIFHLLNRLYKRFPSENLCLAGGVAMNSVVNGKISQNTPFKNIYVPPGGADAGTAIGAAFYVEQQILKQPRRFVLDSAAWGCEFSDEECLQALHKDLYLSPNLSPMRREAMINPTPTPPSLVGKGAGGLGFLEMSEQDNLFLKKLESKELIEQVVDALCEGKVIGWFQGRMEFGARALGNRSILADPRRADMRDIINSKIKMREPFRPFAPSILEEFVGEYFETSEPTPFMERVLTIRFEKRELIPAVTHIDGTGRLQTVSRERLPLYWDLIGAFAQRTGIPILLNSSFNENEPIVCTPEEAIKCFLRTDMDVLILGSYYVERKRVDVQEKVRSASTLV